MLQWSNHLTQSKGSESTKTSITSTFVSAALNLLKKTMQEDQLSAVQWMKEKWRSKWESMTTPLHLQFPTPQQKHAGLDLPRLAWTCLNRLRTRVGRCNLSMHKWGLSPSATCECGMEEQTLDHILCTCPMYLPLMDYVVW